jgi:5'-3' exonuclease
MRQSGAVPPVVLAVDGNAIVHRSFHSQAGTGFRARGRPYWAVRGLLSQLVAAVDRIAPDIVVVGFDDPDASVRRDRWPQYKAQRVAKLGKLVEQLAAAAEAMQTLGVGVVTPAGLEADDVLASVARRATEVGATTVVMTSDRDAFSLIDAHTRVLRIINGGVDASPMLTAERLVTLIGVPPEQYRDFAALRGDPSDNLPGVAGIGPKTAARLLSALGSARAAFDDPAAVAAALGAGVAARFTAEGARERWELNCQVMTMHNDLPIDLPVDVPGAVGRLPLAVDAVHTAFGFLDLPATAAIAARVLADAPLPSRPARPEPDWNPAPWRGKRLPPLVRRPVSDQLTLF